MNKQLQDFARQQIKAGLAQLAPEQHRVFALMYGRKNGARSVDAALAMPLTDIVDEMEPEKLDWCMQQVSSTLHALKFGQL
jgi:hypothetical protein